MIGGCSALLGLIDDCWVGLIGCWVRLIDVGLIDGCWVQCAAALPDCLHGGRGDGGGAARRRSMQVRPDTPDLDRLIKRENRY